jgi:hypothetical protein
MAPRFEVRRQCADTVLMIRPVRFGANPETADTNRFQKGGADAEAAQRAEQEFDGLVSALRAADVDVVVVDDTPVPPKPDACFPNNWISFHSDGSVVLYPLMAPSRRAERRPELLEAVRKSGFRIARTIDLSPLESRGEFLEGTGSLVLDRCHRTAYACRSPRTTKGALAEFSTRLGYRVVAFDALGPDQRPPYHTNVIMAIGEGFALLCAAAIQDVRQRSHVLRELSRAGHEPLEIGLDAVSGFAGNLLALRSADGRQVIALSDAAWMSLEPAIRAKLEAKARIVTAPIPTIERHGGGSVRCMMAEVFLPHRPGAVPAQ